MSTLPRCATSPSSSSTGWAPPTSTAGARRDGAISSPTPAATSSPSTCSGTAPRRPPTIPAAYAHLESSIEAGIEAARPASPDGTVDAIGFSLGALLLLRLAAKTPERFGRLVLMGVGENAFRRDDAHGDLAAAFEKGGDPEDVQMRLFVQLARTAGNDPLAMAACIRRPAAPFTPADAARVTCPTLVIIGDRDFAGPPEPLVDALPNAELVVLKGIDHFRTPSEFDAIDAALEFVEAVPPDL